MNSTVENYAAFKPCGCLAAVASNADDYKKQCAKSVAEWIRKGYEVRGISTVDVRNTTWKCPHKAERPANEQPALFALEEQP